MSTYQWHTDDIRVHTRRQTSRTYEKYIREDPSVNPNQFEDPVLKSNEKYKYHPSIKAIKEELK